MLYFLFSLIIAKRILSLQIETMTYILQGYKDMGAEIVVIECIAGKLLTTGLH
jgi:hypothetical protein